MFKWTGDQFGSLTQPGLANTDSLHPDSGR